MEKKVESVCILSPFFTMKKFLISISLLSLTACGTQLASEQTVSSSASSQASSSVSSMSSEWKSVVLTDQTYDIKSSKAQWLTDIGTKLVQGNVSEARLQIDLSRGNDDKGWSAIGMYIAPQATFGEGNATFKSPDESVYGTNLHFINAVWRGSKGADSKCQRSLAPSSSFGVLKEHSNHLTVDLSAMPVTAKDPCDTSVVTLDLAKHLSDGLYIGFMPSNRGYHAKVTLEYKGDITVKPF